MKYLYWSDTVRFLHFSILFVANKKANVRAYPQGDGATKLLEFLDTISYVIAKPKWFRIYGHVNQFRTMPVFM